MGLTGRSTSKMGHMLGPSRAPSRATSKLGIAPSTIGRSSKMSMIGPGARGPLVKIAGIQEEGEVHYEPCCVKRPLILYADCVVPEKTLSDSANKSL